MQKYTFSGSQSSKQTQNIFESDAIKGCTKAIEMFARIKMSIPKRKFTTMNAKFVKIKILQIRCKMAHPKWKAKLYSDKTAGSQWLFFKSCV